MFTRKPNKILEKYRQGESSYGMQMYMTSCELYELVGYAGFDFIMLDMEHSRVNDETMVQLLRTADSVDVTVFVRVPANEPKRIRYALEAGARGIVIPHIMSADDVKKAQRALRFPPEGQAGICPAVRSAKYAHDTWEEYMRESNENTSLIVLFEDVEAIENCESILAELKPGRDGFGMGNADIVHSLYTDAGQPINWRHPYIQTAADTVVPRAKARGLIQLSMALSPDKAGIEYAKNNGADAIMFHPDVDLYSRLLTRIMNEIGSI
jgi:4-hydroxy-2-oxoheptanedioate aldolase